MINKTIEKNINNYTKNNKNFYKKYVEYEGQKAITNDSSIILLNNLPNDYGKIENYIFSKYIKNFQNMEIIKNINITEIENFKSEIINNRYYNKFNIKEVKKILGIIKKSSIYLLKDKINDVYILKLENKNNEVAFLLPMKVY